MCDIHDSEPDAGISSKTVRVTEAVGTVLAHDITEIRPGEFKGRAFKKATSSGKRTCVTSSGSARSISLF